MNVFTSITFMFAIECAADKINVFDYIIWFPILFTKPKACKHHNRWYVLLKKLIFSFLLFKCTLKQ